MSTWTFAKTLARKNIFCHFRFFFGRDCSLHTQRLTQRKPLSRTFCSTLIHIYIYIPYCNISIYMLHWGKEQKENSAKSSNVLKASSPPPASQQSKKNGIMNQQRRESRATKNPHQKVIDLCARQCRGQDTDSSSFETLSWSLSWASNRLVARHLAIRLDTVLQTEKFPASIANLDSWRSILFGTSWNVYKKQGATPKIFTSILPTK